MSDDLNQNIDSSAEKQTDTSAKKDYAQLIQAQVAELKDDVLKRVEALKAQFPLSQEDLQSLKETVKSEISSLLEDVTQVSKEIKQDLSDLSVKHKETISETLQRTKEHTLEAWGKIHSTDDKSEVDSSDKDADKK